MSALLVRSDPPLDLTDRIIRSDTQFCAGGSFGDVYRCMYRSDSGLKEVAVKALRFTIELEEREGIGGDKWAKMVKRELGIWRRLDHKNIVPFLGTATGFGLSGCVALVSLWMPNGTLQKFLDEHDGKLAIARRFELLLGISSGLLYLHSFPIIHGDLNSNNVLIDETFSARLADFGYASVVGEMEQNMAYLQASMQRPGAVRWAAPEQVLDDVEMTWEPTPLSDIYSFGNVVLQVLSGKQPWSEMRSDVVVLLQLAKGVNPSRPQSRPIDDEHWKFIQQCWLPVQERPPATHLVPKLQHFLNRINCPYDIADRIIRSDDQPCHRSSFGYVYRCEYRSDSGLKKVAVKVVEYNIELEEEKTRGDDRDKMIRQELEIWRRLDHKNIVPFLGTATGFGLSSSVALVSLWMPNGTLQRFLDKRDGKLAIAQGLELLLGIASGLIYLHSYPIIHGDLNSNNVLIDKTFSARLAGFCHASVVGHRERILAYPQESKQCQVAVRWAAPELVPQELEKTCEPTPLSDIYSFGNIALQVLSGKQPWSETKIDDDVLSQLAKGVNPGRPQSRPIDDGHWEFIQQCWLPVQERPPAIDLVPKLQHFLDMIYVVVVFGRMGMGISSLVNLIIGKTEAEVSNDAQQCTQKVGRYDADIDDTKLEVCDIPGFDVSKKSMDNAVASIVQIHKKRGIDLLINCLQPTHGIVPRYYQAVTSAVGSEVPIAAVVTHLEREDGAMENWWSRNGGTLESQKKLKFVDHACVTTAGLCATNHDRDTNTLRRRESERAVRALISRHCKGPKRPPGS